MRGPLILPSDENPGNNSFIFKITMFYPGYWHFLFAIYLLKT
jgi:hypothetical protein